MSNKARRLLVLLLIILKETGRTAACSSSCSSDCDCSRRSLSSVPQDLPTTITRLRLEENAITNLSQSDFSRYRSLTRLNLNHNQISMIHNKTFHNLTSLTWLELNYNQLTGLSADIFEGLHNLRYLYLYQNQLTSLPADIFVGLGNLGTLWLHDNQLTNLSADIFVGLGRLSTLVLSQNQLTSLPAGIFEGLGSLWDLSLSRNQLASLLADIFVGLGNLGYLQLSENESTSLPADIFKGLGNLRSLSLYQNQLTNLSADIFVGLADNLERLILDRNQITNLPAGIFVGLGNLQTLWLYQNQLTNLPADIFVGLGNLQYLYLYQNQLTNLPADIFVGLGKLERLDLSRNSIRSIEAGMFNDTTQLHTLDLEYNSISTIAANIYDLLASISTVDISNNPWQCDCRMAPFKQRMNGSYPFENQIRCAGPGNLVRQYLRDVNPEDLICEETTPVYSTLSTKRIVDSTLNLSTDSSSPFPQSAKLTSMAQTSSPTPSNTPTAVLNPKSTSKAPTLSPTPSNTPTADLNPKSTSKAPMLSPRPSNTPTADSYPGWSTASTAPLFDPSIKSTSSQTPHTANPSDTNPTRSTVSSYSPFGFQSTMTESNTDDPTGGGIFLSMPFVATLCVFLGLFIISTIGLTVWCMYKRRERDPNAVQDSSNSNPAGTSIGLDPIRQPTGINSQSKMSLSGIEDSGNIYNVPTDGVDTEYNTIAEINQSECPKKGAGNMQSLDSFGYLVLPPSLPPENQTGPQVGARSESAAVAGGDTWTNEAEYDDVMSPIEAAKGGPKSHKYMNTHEIAAAKDAAENDDEPVDKQSQTAAAPGADSPIHYEPLRNPSSQQQHTYTSLMPHDSQHH